MNQASGIASNTSSLPEVTSNEALMIDSYDEDGLLHALKRAIDDKHWLESCSLAGVSKADDFTWNKCGQATIQVYEKVKNQTN